MPTTSCPCGRPRTNRNTLQGPSDPKSTGNLMSFLHNFHPLPTIHTRLARKRKRSTGQWFLHALLGKNDWEMELIGVCFMVRFMTAWKWTLASNLSTCWSPALEGVWKTWRISSRTDLSITLRRETTQPLMACRTCHPGGTSDKSHVKEPLYM